jgi:shikimate kinase
MRIFIVGFMGCGKSYLGQLWAAENKLSFYDLDKLIEEEVGMPITTIFEKNGETFFRETESKLLKKTSSLHNCIIACGGGTACFFDNMEWMKNNGTVVFLNETIDKILSNIENDKQVRPLMLNLSLESKKQFIEQKLEERMPFYKQSHLTLLSENLHKNAFVLIQYFIDNNHTNA